MIVNSNKRYLYLLILLIILVILWKLLIKNIGNSNTKLNYELGKVLERCKRSIIYEIDKIENKINKDYLYKKILIIEKTDVEEQVKINNNFKYSPKIIDFGKDYYIIEKYTKMHKI
mgnify:CR=1 FL=1